jgi:preprotein translocase SecE subunit
MSKNNVVEVSNTKTDSKKNVKQEKIKKDKNKGNFKRKANDTVGELKKVTWPDFGTIMKKTGTVLAFCAISLVFLLLIDLLLQYLVGLLSL